MGMEATALTQMRIAIVLALVVIGCKKEPVNGWGECMEFCEVVESDHHPDDLYPDVYRWSPGTAACLCGIRGPDGRPSRAAIGLSVEPR